MGLGLRATDRVWKSESVKRHIVGFETRFLKFVEEAEGRCVIHTLKQEDGRKSGRAK